MANIRLESVSKRYPDKVAVDNVSFEVPNGSFFALLGPSGCGKTTILRLIAGLERPDAGEIALGARPVAGRGGFVGPEHRGLGMVFQSYALWPHMTVAANIDFGLAGRGLSRADRRRRVHEALDLVGLSAEGARRPHQLSGGQRQRVALARSLAVRPEIILLDEPLANLDAHLRQTMLAEFGRIHAQAKTTFVFVTHDQNEAMALADQVAVMDRGRLQQLAPPEELFARPASPMVARFVGQGRLLAGDVLASGEGTTRFRLDNAEFQVEGRAPVGPGWLCLRARDVQLAKGGGSGERLNGRVVGSRFEGGDHRLTVQVGETGAVGSVDVLSPQRGTIGEAVCLALRGGWVLAREAA
ncbi:ABC transporter ATP-binding protein [Pleomorphomonas sp. NRK KF1]|uniref:ABC transporter ATP-binding protein n=1 Tax=Pleomorphomonas sp. NRK KF1 TaxID=2943000 RepID=UPI002043FC6D|nr:ABC transporter ATP-binding protein [Pleomorphomonas sp. NRK KF1]MCM5551578.1 ABC transporter ATP-binding protein [Pleomorphomonas sp. NRK KF1]